MQKKPWIFTSYNSQKGLSFMSLKDGVKIIIQDVVEPEPEKEGCLTKIGSFLVVMAIIITVLVLLFKFFMNHLFLFFILLVGIIIVATKFGRN